MGAVSEESIIRLTKEYMQSPYLGLLKFNAEAALEFRLTVRGRTAICQCAADSQTCRCSRRLFCCGRKGWALVWLQAL